MANIVVLGGGDIGADFWTKKGRILMEGYSSNTLKSCKDIEEVVELINSAPILEGIEGIEFTPEELAAEYAYDVAIDNLGKEPIEDKELEAHLDIIKEKGAIFSY